VAGSVLRLVGPPATPQGSRDFDQARAAAPFGSVADATLRAAVEAGELRAIAVWRDEIVADGAAPDADADWIYLVGSGQIVVAAFDPDILDDERAWSADLGADERRRKIRPQGPLIHLAERHLAVFGPGDLFNSRAVLAAGDGCAFFAALPATLIAARPDWLGDIAARHPHLAAWLGGALRSARDRLASLPGARAELLDFYVRQGLSAAGTLRVVQIDRCIECHQCERACAERHGVARLTIPGPRLGQLGFAVTCRTCTDQRCLSVCNFDSIELDADLGEVVIRESSCTGCGGCASACPYGSIQMVQLADPASAAYRARLESRGALAAGPDAPRREPTELIATKCDHCAGFRDQACISHCPTGALVEVAPAALFSGAHGPVRAPALATSPFAEGLGTRRRPGRRLSIAFLWTVGLFCLVALSCEIALRKLAPELSLQYLLLRRSGLEPPLARFNVGYLAGSELSLTLGYVGSALILLSLVHPLRKRWRRLQRLGSGAAWFDLHVLGGTLGPLTIVLHSAFHLANWVAIALWAFATVVVSGLAGRHLLTRLPDRFAGTGAAALLERDVSARTAAAWPRAASIAQAEIDRYRRRARPIGRTGLVGSLVWTAADQLRRPGAWLRRRGHLSRAGAPGPVRRALSRGVARAIAAERRAALAARWAAFLRAWLRVHILFTVVALLVAIAHVFAALRFSM
jgi:Fe-S-cluster-containing hydrogenase component 2